MITLGTIIVSICVGCIYGEVHGWMAFGLCLLLYGIIDYIDKGYIRNK